MNFRVQFLDGLGSVVAEWSAYARDVAGVYCRLAAAIGVTTAGDVVSGTTARAASSSMASTMNAA